MKEEIVTLQNGRTYKITDTETPYQLQEYPTGGLVIHAKDDRYTSGWVYIDNSPDNETKERFLQSAARLSPIEQ
jgi:hypothetical protein